MLYFELRKLIDIFVILEGQILYCNARKFGTLLFTFLSNALKRLWMYDFIIYYKDNSVYLLSICVEV